MDVDSDNLDLKFVKDLNKKLLKSFKVRLAAVQYIEDIEEVAPISAAMIEDGDIVISLGASNNNDLYKNIIKELDKR
jgi:UDP-N-acetylmuramate-alanine ligase